uniref:WD repeat-containing protein 7-like isoform X1 n=2 Tax=Myxine glutinosa TaxID=7769 RepID=UPI00358F8FA6
MKRCGSAYCLVESAHAEPKSLVSGSVTMSKGEGSEDMKEPSRQLDNLLLPMVVWGCQVPRHHISCMFLTDDQETVITGCRDGEVCLWNLSSSLQLTPRALLLAHHAAVTCLSGASDDKEEPYFVSAADDGEISLWDEKDGRCLRSEKLPYVHSAMNFYRRPWGGTAAQTLLCCGEYTDVTVIDARSLQLLGRLSSKLMPDWIVALSVLSHRGAIEDTVVGVTISGTLKLWNLDAALTSLQEPAPIYEIEARPMFLTDGCTVTFCRQRPWALLLVCHHIWKVFRSKDFSTLCLLMAEDGELWAGGDFLAVDKVIVWSAQGRGYIYKLPGSCFSDEPQCSDEPANCNIRAPILLFRFYDSDLDQVAWSSLTMSFLCCDTPPYHKFLLCGDAHGTLRAWGLPNMLVVRQAGTVEDLGVTSKASLDGSFPQIEPLLDCTGRSLGGTTELQDYVTASLHLPSERCMLCGCADGRIVLLPLVEFAFASVIQEEVGALSASLNSRVLLGHRGPVSCLLIPHQASALYNHNWLLSGGTDGTVRMWDMAFGTELHMFHGHTGTITQLIVPPEVCFERRGVTICSVASDHSVAMLSLMGIRPMLLTSGHPFPVVAVRWRHAERLLFIACSDGSLYVWQSSTGTLDRCITGLTACQVFASGEEPLAVSKQDIGPGMGSSSPTHLGCPIKNSSPKLPGLRETFDQANCCDGGQPAVSVLPLSAGGIHVAAHVLVFCLESLVLEHKVEARPQELVPKEVKPAAAVMGAQCIPNRKRRSAKDFLHYLTVARPSQVRKAKAESPDLHDGKTNMASQLREIESEEYEKRKLMQARFLMSCLHTWGLDLELDAACEKHLELVQPKHPISFGLLSYGSQVIALSLLGLQPSKVERATRATLAERTLLPDPVAFKMSDRVTTHHLLAVVALAYVFTQNCRTNQDRQGLSCETSEHGDGDEMATKSISPWACGESREALLKMASLHSNGLAEKLASNTFQHPKFELLASHWQNDCLEVRLAAQDLLLSELRRIGQEGRGRLVNQWKDFLPKRKNLENNFLEATQHLGLHLEGGNGPLPSKAHPRGRGVATAASLQGITPVVIEQIPVSKERNSIIFLGTMAVEFGRELEDRELQLDCSERRGCIRKTSLADQISSILTLLLIEPCFCGVSEIPGPFQTCFHWAALDVLHRGLPVFSRHLQIPALLPILLVLGWAPGSYQPWCDTCRHADGEVRCVARLVLGALCSTTTSTCLATLAHDVRKQAGLSSERSALALALEQSRPQLLDIIRNLIETQFEHIGKGISEVTELLIFCLGGQLRRKRSLQEAFPHILRFNTVSFCQRSHRLAVVTRNGTLTLYEPVFGHSQTIQVHAGAVSAVAFSPNGHHMATYCRERNQLCVVQVHDSLRRALSKLKPRDFHQKHKDHMTRLQCTKTLPLPPIPPDTPPASCSLNHSLLTWCSNHQVCLRPCAGQEYIFKI